MKRVLLLFIFAFSYTFLIGQFTINPSSLNVTLSPGEELVTDVNITYSGDDNISTTWELAGFDDIPDGWTLQICDSQLCYDWGVVKSSTSITNNFSKGQTQKWTIHYKDEEGNQSEPFSFCASLMLFESSDTKNSIYETVCTSSTKDHNFGSNAGVQLYPNPTERMLNIANDKNVTKIGICNIVGKEIKKLNHSQNEVHDISDLRSGMYIVRLYNNKGAVIKSLRLSKR
jgi:spore germination protein YaaH